MKKLLCLAAAPLIFLSACATVSTSTNGASSQAASGSLYCWKDRLQVDANSLSCNWAESTSDACKETKRVDLSKSAIVGEPTDAKRCDNGQRLVQVTKK